MMTRRTATQRKVAITTSLHRTLTKSRVHHHVDVVGGVMNRRRVLLVVVPSLRKTRRSAPAHSVLKSNVTSLVGSHKNGRKKMVRAVLSEASSAAAPVKAVIAGKVYPKNLPNKLKSRKVVGSRQTAELDHSNKIKVNADQSHKFKVNVRMVFIKYQI